MSYYELRKEVSKIIPRMGVLQNPQRTAKAVREKGRKKDYQEFNLVKDKWVKQERLLNTEEVNSFLEISCRAAACPMPLNLDIWDGLLCPYGCKYCFANAFRASLYTAFFDNSKTMGLRHCNPDKYKKELDKLMKFRGKNPLDVKNSIGKAIAMNLPIRFGIRFEDFLKREEKLGVSLELLKYLQEQNYPLMINTKSNLVGKKEYVRVLEKGNPGRTAVHITLISSNERLLRELEPAAPSYTERIEAMKVLVRHDVRVVARIEPWIPFVNDGEEETLKYMEDLDNAGVRHLTFDTYSYSAKNPGIAQSFRNLGLDWDRIFLLGCDSQGLSSLLLGKYMEMWREKGFSCSTFDMGNMPSNNQSVCCEIGDWFQDSTFNHGCTVMAARFIIKKKGHGVNWKKFVNYVDKHGGFLSDALKNEVHHLWNFQGNDAYSQSWSQGIVPCGQDEDGIIWKYEKVDDFREDILKGVLERKA